MVYKVKSEPPYIQLFQVQPFLLPLPYLLDFHEARQETVIGGNQFTKPSPIRNSEISRLYMRLDYFPLVYVQISYFAFVGAFALVKQSYVVGDWVTLVKNQFYLQVCGSIKVNYIYIFN